MADDQDGQDGQAGEQGSGQDLSALEAAERAKQLLAELTGRPADTVSSVARGDDGWEVTVELIELERIPPSTDVLGSYLVTLDDQGRLLGYKRISRYLRSQASAEQELS